MKERVSESERESKAHKMTSKSYADSVKLPTLVAVQHPSSRLSHKSTLNIEGHGNSLNKQLSAKTLERKNFITSLIGLC